MLSILVLTTITPAAAQITQPTSLIVRVSESIPGAETQKDYLLRVSSDKAEPFDMPFDETARSLALSPDGQWIASTNIDPDGNKILSYSKKGQPATNVNFPVLSSLGVLSF